MPVTATPVFPQTAISAYAQIATANTNRDGTGTIGIVYSPGANGGRVEYVRIQATVTTTAGVIRLYISDGTTIRLWTETLVTAVTPSTTVQAFSAEVVPTRPIVLPSGWSLRASTHNAETFNVFAHGGDF